MWFFMSAHQPIHVFITHIICWCVWVLFLSFGMCKTCKIPPPGKDYIQLSFLCQSVTLETCDCCHHHVCPLCCPMIWLFFLPSDIAVVDMSDVFRQPSLFYHLGVRESFDMANNVILYHDTDPDTAQSLKVHTHLFWITVPGCHSFMLP